MQDSLSGPMEKRRRRGGESMEPATAARWRSGWAIYLVAGTVLIAVYFLKPAVGLLPDWTPKLVLYNGLSYSAAVAILIGVHLHKPQRRTPWYLLAASQFVYASADTAFYVAHDVLHQDRFPAVADVLYLSHYPILIAGLLLLVRQRTPRGDRASLIDASVIAVSVGLLSWVFLIGPYAIDAQLPTLVKAVSIAYPVADLLVFGVAVRLLVVPGARPVSYYLLAASLLVVLATDSAYVLMQLTGTYSTGNVLDATWLGSYVLLGAAALHPSMRAQAEPGDAGGPRASLLRLIPLAAASLMAPATLVIQASLGRTIDVWVIAAASATLFLLVVARLAGLVDEQRRVAITDELTHLYNRRFFEATLTLEVEQAARSSQDLGLLVLDLDHLKRVNDAYGHQAGDRVLREIANRLTGAIRSGDIIARYGGGEFVVLLRNTSGDALPDTAERLRHAIGDEHAVVAYLERLADEIDARQATEEHSAAISRWAGTIADHLGLGPDTRRSCELAGRFHDIGKIVVPDEILLKPGPLTNREWAVLRRHPVQGARLISLAPGFQQIALIVRQHHERFDGSGYPDQRAGEDIRIEARIVAVCDAWAAMRANRPYNEARSAEEAREQLRIWSGSQFDGRVVEAFLELEQAGATGTFSRIPIRSSPV